MTWHSLHVVYYAENKDSLVLHGVRPLFRHLAPWVTAASYTRHWRLGPHLRLNLNCDQETMATVVWPAAEEIVGGFLARHPSRARLDPNEHLTAHRRLAELEQEAGALAPWRPDNTLHEAAFDRRVHVHGSDEAAELMAGYHADSTELAFRMTEDIVKGRPRLGLAFDIMVCTAHALSGVGITTGFMSFRSHAEAFLAAYPEGSGLRPAWENHYRQYGASLPERVKRIVASLDDGSGEVDFVDDWAELMRAYHQRARRLLARGQLPMDPQRQPSTGTSPDLAQVSPYHRAAFANPAVVRSLTAEWFVVYRLMLNYTYLYMTRLGIAPVERFLLCHLAANAVEDTYDIVASEKIKQAPPMPTLEPLDDPS